MPENMFRFVDNEGLNNNRVRANAEERERALNAEAMRIIERVNADLNEVRNIHPVEEMPDDVDLRNRIQRRMERRIMVPLVVDTIGVELEGLFTSRDSMGGILFNSFFGEKIANMLTITRDASAEIPVFSLNRNRLGERGRYINGGTKLARKIFRGNNTSVFGYELVTRPLLYSDMEFLMLTVLNLINKYGGFYSDRCATHVHIGISNNLNTAKSALAFSAVFEEIFYAIAGFGKEYRGAHNNSAYARPVVGGLYVPFRDSFIKIPNINKALNAKNMYEFYYAFHVDIGERLIKHHPSRYFGINMYSIIEKGTLEFRTANMITNFADMMAYIELCQSSAELVLNTNFNLFREMVYGNPFVYESPSYYINRLKDLNYLINKYNHQYKLSDESLETLSRIIENTPPFDVGKENVQTHIRDFSANREMVYMGELESCIESPEPPCQVDIHNINRKNIFII